jgi:hypothetical protein
MGKGGGKGEGKGEGKGGCGIVEVRGGHPNEKMVRPGGPGRERGERRGSSALS